MDSRELDRLEREANEALYRVDPEFARELGYEPPPPPPPPTPLSRYIFEQLELEQQQQKNMLGGSSLQAQQSPMQHAISGGAFAPGGALGSVLGPLFGR